MSKNQDKTSKLISYWLRHKPEEANLQLNEFGWVKIDEVLKALRLNNISFSQKDLIDLNNSFDKVRWKIDLISNQIKATHGHSISILQEDKPQIPHEILYHGTAVKNLISIIENGLKSGQRQYVHLSESMGMALEVAKRHGKPFIIEVDTKRLMDAGWNFYKTEENVWLTSDIPDDYLDFEPWSFTKDEELNKNLIAELKKEVNRSHILSKKINKLKLVARHNPDDDCLFIDIDDNKYYVVHPTWSGKTEIDDWPNTEEYESFKDWVDKKLVPNQENWY